MTRVERLRVMADALDATHDIWDEEARLVREAASELHRLEVENAALRALHTQLFEAVMARARQEEESPA